MPTSPEAPGSTVAPALDETAEAATERRERLRRGRLVTAVLAGVLVVVVGVVALLGGFRARTDQRTRVEPGSLIVSGPFELTLDSATVQHKTDENEWDVVAAGRIRTTGTTSIAPSEGDSGFLAARSESTREVQSSNRTSLGAPDATARPENLTPGLPPVPWTATFVFHADPGTEVLIAVTGQQYTTPYIFGTEMGWQATDDASILVLSAQRLPDQEF